MVELLKYIDGCVVLDMLVVVDGCVVVDMLVVVYSTTKETHQSLLGAILENRNKK